jgi:hypothetical protein
MSIHIESLRRKTCYQSSPPQAYNIDVEGIPGAQAGFYYICTYVSTYMYEILTDFNRYRDGTN